MYSKESHESLCGILFLAIAIQGDGSVAGVEVIGSTMKAPSFEAKVVSHVKAMTFEPFPMTGFDVFVYPIVFAPSPSQQGVPADRSRPAGASGG